MKESQIQTKILDVLSPYCAWLYVTTTGRFQGRGKHWFTIGFPGLSDIVGQLKDGRMLCVEVKKVGEKPTEEQYEHLRLVALYDGFGFWCDSPEQAEKYIKLSLQMQ